MKSVSSIFSSLVAGFVMSFAVTQFPFTDNGTSASNAYQECMHLHEPKTCGMGVLAQAAQNTALAMVATADLIKNLDH